MKKLLFTLIACGLVYKAKDMLAEKKEEIIEGTKKMMHIEAPSTSSKYGLVGLLGLLGLLGLATKTLNTKPEAGS